MSVREYEIVSLIGPNGAGKSSLFDIICGISAPSKGQVIFFEQDITSWAPHRIARAGIGRTFQIARPFSDMTAAENVMVAVAFGKENRLQWRMGRKKAIELLERVELAHKADLPARELTISELRRLELARALGTTPKVLLLDEIAAGLSPQAIMKWAELIQALRRQGLTVLLIDHFLSLTVQISDRLIALCHGEKVAEGKPEDVIRSPQVIAAYLGDTRVDIQED